MQLEDERQSSDDEDEDKYVDKMDMPGTKMDAAERYTVRNLRIREDTAKYLRNLDLSSAHYDPKTRSMRKNPYEGTGKSQDEVDFAGDNFVRITGDTINHAQSQVRNPCHIALNLMKIWPEVSEFGPPSDRLKLTESALCYLRLPQQSAKFC